MARSEVLITLRVMARSEVVITLRVMVRSEVLITLRVMSFVLTAAADSKLSSP